ncbi:MAG: HAMP domain-containing histidine kinase [Gemmataceae bacterium]|nr:HAMP domain-containing histidine kinase [Gemmataceae bacterium]MDW8266759.1 ATP-binding protein [Gemmataceae bacterium]
MSYRAFKRLLGETSLERKCRFLFGAGTLLLIFASFWWYARQTEHLAYDQLTTTGQLLVNPIVALQHVEEKQRQRAMEEFQANWEANWPEAMRKYQYRIIKPAATRPEHQPSNEERKILKEFLADPEKYEESRPLYAQGDYHYYGAIRASARCISCHQRTGPERAELGDLKEGDLIAVVKISMPTEAIEVGVHRNRAWLLSTALVTALLIMAGSYLIVRYVIVKPVKHLKEVSDAISAGELNVRSEIQTGDEFEDLSHAFNRMLRNLVDMSDRLRKVNADLDRKVDELAQANLALYESNRLKSHFLATVSHELRTPLNSILGFSDVLLSSDHLTDKQRRWLQNIKTSGDRLLALVNDILDLAKIEAGKMEVRLEEFSIHDVIEGLLNMFRPLAEKKNIDLRGQVDPKVPLLRQDAGKLQQILSNLLSNAIKFTPEGGRVLLKAEADSGQLILTVSDTGVGIAPQEQELVFEKFRQAGNPLTREQGGTGLGLSIVRELTKLLGGQVTLRSDLGRGTTFTVRLPLTLSAERRLEFDLTDKRIDLSKAQRVDVRHDTPYSPPASVHRPGAREGSENLSTGQPAP